MKFVTFCKRTDYPKLGYLIYRLKEMGIPCRFASNENGLIRSFHASHILEVDEVHLEKADALLSEDCSDSALARAAALLQARADPLDDVRGSAHYRRALIPRLLLRAVRQLAVPTGAVQ